jgi:hypothetical protein
MAFWLKTDGSISEVKPDHDARDGIFTLQQLQAFVGGYIEIVHTHTGALMIVNEDGKNHGLPFNLLATERYRFGEHDPIVGNVLICTMEEIEREEEEEAIDAQD